MTKKVLVVDDEPFILRSLSFVLRKERYEVIEARDGEEALEAIEQHRPDLVFLDVMMPRMSGFDVTRKVRATPELAETRIILLTAKGQDSDEEDGRRAGANDYMTKPFSPSKIVEKVRQMLDGDG
jgi:DNA-binding response OmpR family regulator